MNQQFTAAEIEQIIQVARITALDLTPEQFQEMVEAQEQLKNTGFIEASWAVAKLHREKGIAYQQADQAVAQLLGQKSQIEVEMNQLTLKEAGLRQSLSVDEEASQRLKEDIQQAQQELGALQQRRQEEERQLETFRTQAEQEKEKLRQEVEEGRRKAGLSVQEIEAARWLKAEFEKQDFGLEVAHLLCQEFAKSENPRKEMAEALQKYGSFTKYLKEINRQGESQKKEYQGQIQTLSGQKTRLEADNAFLETEINNRYATIGQLDAGIAQKADILYLYNRYLPIRNLIEYLGSFNTVAFFHCKWCGATYWLLNPGSTKHSRQQCLWCNLEMAQWDEGAYQALGWPPGYYRLLPPQEDKHV